MMQDPASRVGSVLVPIDGSPASESAIPVGLALARARGAVLRVVHVFVPVAPEVEPSPDDVAFDALQQEMREGARSYLREVGERLAGEKGVSVACDFIDGRGVRSPFGESASVVAALLRHAERWKASLIVMTTHGRGGLSRAWLGSVADGLTRESRIPLLLVRPGDGHPAVPPAAFGFTRIVVPLDGSAPAADVIPRALALADRNGARLTLVHVVVPRHVLARPAPVARVDAPALASQALEAERDLAACAGRLTTEHVAADAIVLVDEQPARAILALAERTGADAIAMSTHGRGGFRRLMLGSVADKVVRGAHCAVLLHRPPWEEA